MPVTRLICVVIIVGCIAEGRDDAGRIDVAAVAPGLGSAEDFLKQPTHLEVRRQNHLAAQRAVPHIMRLGIIEIHDQVEAPNVPALSPARGMHYPRKGVGALERHLRFGNDHIGITPAPQLLRQERPPPLRVCALRLQDKLGGLSRRPLRH